MTTKCVSWLLTISAVKRLAACLVVAAGLLTGCAQQPDRPTPTDQYAQMERELDAGLLDLALRTAERLIADHPGTAEARKATDKIPQIKEAMADKWRADKIRAAMMAAEADARRLADKWTYDCSTDPMTSRNARYANIASENLVNFDVPYDGPQRATLQLRDHPTYGRDVIFSIERGQLLCRSWQDCVIRVRFDELPAEEWNAIGPQDGSSTSIFLRSEDLFVARLRKAKRVRVQLNVYQEGAPTFEFLVGGFSPSRHREGC